MPNKKNNEFDNWNSEYDIPDDPKPVNEQEDLSTEEEKYLHKQYMLTHLSELREEAMKLRLKQLNYWDSYGDNYMLDEVPYFILRNKEDIVGVVKDAKWILTANIDEWEDDFRLYYGLMIRFIKVSQYVIESYKQSLKKLERE